ncbi:MAG: type II CAAX endopeptidase family protein [Chloroflexota bacterium]
MEHPTKHQRSIFARIFISPDEPRLRAGWRLLIQTILMVVIAMGFSIPLLLLSEAFQFAIDGLILNQIIELFVITVSVYLARRFLDRRTFVSLGLKLDRRAAFDVLAGIVITGLMMGLIYIIEWGAGWLSFESFAWQVQPVENVLSGVVLMLVIFIFVGWNEELLSRGYHLQTLTSGINLTWGVVLSSAVFGVLHLGNPNATWVSTAGIFFAGVFLAYGYIRTRQLWLSIGLHIGWNFFEGVVFGFPVSGLSDIPRLILHTVDGPELITGGAFGPEAGLVMLPALIAGALAIWWYAGGRPVEQESVDQ